MKFAQFILLSGSLSLAACIPSDVGDDCSQKVDGEQQMSDVGETNSESVTFNATERKDARCESFSCISTRVRNDYCSQKCTSDRGCPDGFICDVLQPIGPLKTEKFCQLEKTCEPNITNSCPQPDFQCNRVVTSDENRPLYLCDQKKPKSKNGE